MKKKIYNEHETLIINECNNIIANNSFAEGLKKFLELREKYPEDKELISFKTDCFIKINY